MTVGTQAKWLVRTAVSSAGRNLECKQNDRFSRSKRSPTHPKSLLAWFTSQLRPQVSTSLPVPWLMLVKFIPVLECFGLQLYLCVTSHLHGICPTQCWWVHLWAMITNTAWLLRRRPALRIWIRLESLINVLFINGWFDVAPFTQLVLGGLLHQHREFPHEVTTELVLLQDSRHHG